MLNCTKKSTPSVTPPTMSKDSTFTYLALGDSYTIGESVAEAERFPNQLADSLRIANIKIGTVKIVARTGWTTDELQNGIVAAGLTEANTFDMVTLLIGVNNQYRNRSVEEYKPQFTALLERAIQFAGGKKERVIVVSIPDYAYTPFGGGRKSISDGIDAYNAANEAITRAKGVAYAQITPISREGLNDPTLVASDQLHPSGKQYSRWVSVMLPIAKAFFK
ncbi:MAG: SGNH/GDSL hydrolase family protein [Saprospiraceae bacterium]|nr:SGNH/GDSL hydrolase family protein [Saprospiraceae bacterium]